LPFQPVLIMSIIHFLATTTTIPAQNIYDPFHPKRLISTPTFKLLVDTMIRQPLNG
jgi:hypothetical protein